MWLPDKRLLGHSEQLKIAGTVGWPEVIHKLFLHSYLILEENKASAVITQLCYQVCITYELHVSAIAAVAIIRVDTIYQRSYIDKI